jgi:GTP-binding protein
MALERRQDVRNLALIAHVDHGKSTVVDALLWQTAALADGRATADLAGMYDPGRAKAVPVVPKLTSVLYHSVRVNLVDLPGHANFGTEVDRILRLVDGFVLVVDACEGPLPQNRYVLRKALEAGLAPVLVLNKIDRPTADPERVLRGVRDLFVDLDATEAQRTFPVLRCNALRGACAVETPGRDATMVPLLDAILESVPAPAHDPTRPFRLQVTQVGYDDFLGRLAVGRVVSGTVRPADELVHLRIDGDRSPFRPSGLFGWQGTRRVEIAGAGPGDLVAFPGVERVRLGDTLASPAEAEPLPELPAEEATIAIDVAVNDSPTAGQDGTHANAEELRERLWRELLTNPSIRIEDTGSVGGFRVCGRSELQLAILLEMLRREEYELLAGRPRILTRDIEGVPHEPVETLVIDCPEVFAAVVSQKIEARGGRMTRMVNHGRGRVRVEYSIPSAGLLGFRAEYLADTRRTGILNHAFDGYQPGEGEIPERSTGALVSDRGGRATAHAIEHLQSRGTMFVAPGDPVYAGMIVGENSGGTDVSVNPTKARPAQPESVHPTAATVTRLVPPRSLSLEQALEFLREDEVVELTPRALRLRRRKLDD